MPSNKPPVLISSGSLDATFGDDGLTSTAIGSGTDQARAIAIQSDGKYVVAGWTDAGGGNYDFAVARFNTDGSLDASFSGDGKQATALAAGTGADRAYGVAIQSDGKIVVAGATSNGLDDDFAIVRYNADGSLDGSFSGDGVQTTSLSASNDNAAAIAIQSDGKILVAGSSGSNFAIARYESTGELDTTFDADGKFTGSFGNDTSVANAMALQADGKIIVAGYGWSGSSWDFGVARLTTAGGLDSSFSDDGKALISIDSGSSYIEEVNAIAIQSDGKILLAGRTIGSGTGDAYDAVLIRLDANGNLDTGFGGGDGIVTLNLSTWDDFNSVVAQADGKILAAGSAQTGAGSALITRFNADGTLDISFDGDGVFSTSFGSGTSAVYSLAVAPSGQVVAAGDSWTGTYDFGMLRLASGINDQTAISGNVFSYAVPDGAFFDADGDPLTYSAMLSDGSALPSWLSFDAATRTFSGTPADGDFGTRQVKVTASDGSASVSASFQLEVATLTSITVPYDAVRSMIPPNGDVSDAPRWNASQALGSPVSLTYCFSDSATSYAYSANGYTSASAQTWTASQKSAIGEVLTAYSKVAGLSFTPVSSQDQANISLFLSSSITAAGFANYPGDVNELGSVAGDVFFQTASFPADGSNLYLAFHEIGHALGLAHPYDGGSKPTIESFGLDGSRLFSVVDQRLTDQPYYLTSDSYGIIFNPTGPMILDIAALQSLYGPNNATAASDDIYSFDVNPNFYKTIWDAGGHDTIDVSNQVNPSLISLVEGAYSTVGFRDPFEGFPAWLTSWAEQNVAPKAQFNEGANSLVIAFGAVIEDVIGSPATDILIGNAVANVLRGEGGNDRLLGGAGNDTLDGGIGTDIAVYSGLSSQYQVTLQADGSLLVADQRSDAPDGMDTVSHIELFQFTDATYTAESVPSVGKTANLLVYDWKSHTLLDGVSIVDASHSGTTDANGSTSFTGITNSSLALTASRSIPGAEATLTSQAVNLQDAIAILKMIVGLDVNGAGHALSPYQSLAADYNGDGTVGLTDAIDVLKHVVGLPAPDPAWRFVNEIDATIPGKVGLSPGTLPTTISADMSAATPVHVGLVGLLNGDVDGSFAGTPESQDLDNLQPSYFVDLTSAYGLQLSQFGVYT